MKWSRYFTKEEKQAFPSHCFFPVIMGIIVILKENLARDFPLTTCKWENSRRFSLKPPPLSKVRNVAPPPSSVIPQTDLIQLAVVFGLMLGFSSSLGFVTCAIETQERPIDKMKLTIFIHQKMNTFMLINVCTRQPSAYPITYITGSPALRKSLLSTMHRAHPLSFQQNFM